MNNWQVVSLDAQAPQAWRNGGGLTRELLAWPSPAHWRVRLSVADVQGDGPFSRFDGIERWFAVLEGAGVDLRVDGAAHRITASAAPFRFDGAAQVDCALVHGATRDFNLMAPPGAAHMWRVAGAVDLSWAAPCLLGLYTHAQPATLVAEGTPLALRPAQLAWCMADGAGRVRIEAPDALWMEIAR